jgi:biotin transporter BioY
MEDFAIMKTGILFVLFCGTPGLLFATGSPSLQALALFWPFLWGGILAAAFTVRYLMDQRGAN